MNTLLQVPTAFCYNIKQVRAIVLGTDPSNLSNNGKRKVLTKTFGIGDSDSRYFDGILSNLKEVGLNLESIYVQNLVQEYLEKDISENLSEWKMAAKRWLPVLKEELKIFNDNMPVLLTSAYIYDLLVIGEWKKYKPKDFYKSPRVNIPVPAECNLLGRPLVPFYRNRRIVDYHLTNSEWDAYKKAITELTTKYLG